MRYVTAPSPSGFVNVLSAHPAGSPVGVQKIGESVEGQSPHRRHALATPGPSGSPKTYGSGLRCPLDSAGIAGLAFV